MSLLISVPVFAGVPDAVEATPTTTETQPTAAETQPVAAQTTNIPVEAPMKGFYIGGEFSFNQMEAETTFNSTDTITEYDSGPVSILVGYTGKIGDVYGRYTITDTEAEDYDGIKEYGIGVRFHSQLKVGKTGFNTRVEALMGDTDGDTSYSGALLGMGATTRAGKNVVINYGIDYRSINWDIPYATGYYMSRSDDGFGVYVNMHFLFAK